MRACVYIDNDLYDSLYDRIVNEYEEAGWSLLGKIERYWDSDSDEITGYDWFFEHPNENAIPPGITSCLTER